MRGCIDGRPAEADALVDEKRRSPTERHERDEQPVQLEVEGQAGRERVAPHRTKRITAMRTATCERQRSSRSWAIAKTTTAASIGATTWSFWFVKTVSPRRQTAVAKTTDEIRGPRCPSPMTSCRRRPAGAAGELTPDVVPLAAAAVPLRRSASGRTRGRRFSRTNASPIVASSTVRKITMGVVLFARRRGSCCWGGLKPTCRTTRLAGGILFAICSATM